MSATETPPSVVRFTSSNFSMRVIAAAIILLFFYYAAGVVITLLLSILLAYFLDPAVEFLERFGLPRTLGAMVMVLISISVLAAVGYGLWTRTADFAENWPKYSRVLEQAAGAVEGKIRGIEGQVSQIAPEQGASSSATVRTEPSIVRTLIFRGVGSLYALFLEITFMPFLVFFMLAEKRELWHGTLQLFPASRRTQVKETLEDLRDVLRDYLAGMTIVTLVVIAASSLFFWITWLPAFVIALAKWKTLGQFVLIAATLTTIHVLAINLVAPQLVGRRVRLNAVAITIALLFWGWVWGGMGLVLAIPITAALRVICDHTESWKPIGRWLSA